MLGLGNERLDKKSIHGHLLGYQTSRLTIYKNKARQVILAPKAFTMHLILLNLALLATGVNGFLILLRFFFGNSRTLSASISPWALAAVSLPTVTSVAFRRAACHALRVTLPSTPAFSASGASGVTTVVKLVTAAAGIASCTVETFALVFASVEITVGAAIVVAVSVTLAFTVTIPVLVAIIAALATVTGG